MESSLQVGLAVIGGLVLAGVVAYNTWNSRRHTPRQPYPVADAQEPGLAGEHEVAAGATERQEPGFGDWNDDLRADRDDDSDRPLDVIPDQDDGTHAVAPSAAREHATRIGTGTDANLAAGVKANADTGLAPEFSRMAPAERKPGQLDALIDVIAPIATDGVVSGDAAIAALPGTRRAGSKPFFIEGLNQMSNGWEPPHLGRRYTAFQAGVQLANRNGALNEIEFSEFVMKAQAFADAISGAPDFPDMIEQVARARELDQFASAHDAQLGFTLRARTTAWSPGYVQQQAGRLGFVAGAIPGRMVLPASQQGLPPVLVLSFDTQAALAEDLAQAALHEVALSLDVPQVSREERPFERLREVAQELATAMDGVIADDNGTPLYMEAMDSIAQELEHLYNALDEHDLAAGSPQARRLFS